VGAPVGKLGERIEVGGSADGTYEEKDGLGLDMVIGPVFGFGGRNARGVGFGVMIVVDGSPVLAGSEPGVRLAVCGWMAMLGSWGGEYVVLPASPGRSWMGASGADGAVGLGVSVGVINDGLVIIEP
jgi:hypothetical protein